MHSRCEMLNVKITEMLDDFKTDEWFEMISSLCC